MSKHEAIDIDRCSEDPRAIENLVEQKAEETDHLEFKKEWNRRDPKAATELRADAAALASMGKPALLLIGVDEARDGTNRAEAIVPVAEPFDVKRSVEDLLASGIDPPIRNRVVRVVETSNGAVVTLRVVGEGGQRYPHYVEGLADTPFLVREAGKKRRLTSADARVRRRRFYRRAPTVFAGVAIVLAILGPAVVWWLKRVPPPRRLDAAQVASLRAELSKAPGRRVSVILGSNDRETIMYAGDLTDALNAAGVVAVRQPSPTDIAATGTVVAFGPGPDAGCEFRLEKADDLDSTPYRIFHALDRAGVDVYLLPCADVVRWWPRDHPAIVVGQRPGTDESNALVDRWPLMPRATVNPLPDPP